MKKNLIESKTRLKEKLSLLTFSTMILVMSTFLLLTTVGYASNNTENPVLLKVECNDLEIEDCAVVSMHEFELMEPIEIEDIFVYEVEEEVLFDFDTKEFLPVGFNPLKGLHALDWNNIELLEPDYDMDVDYNIPLHKPKVKRIKNYLEAKEWNSIVLNKLEKSTSISFNVSRLKSYDLLLINSLDTLNWDKIIEQKIEGKINFNHNTIHNLQ